MTADVKLSPRYAKVFIRTKRLYMLNEDLEIIDLTTDVPTTSESTPQVDVQQHNSRARKDTQGPRRNCRDDSERRESGASHSQGNAHRGARRRVSTAPVTKRRQTDSPARQFTSRSETPSIDSTSHQAVADRQPSPPVQVGTNQRTCERPTQLQRVNITSVQRTTHGLPPSGAAVQASLAPAQPPPPAGLASSPACHSTL